MGTTKSSDDNAAEKTPSPRALSEGRWRSLIAEVGAEIAQPLTAALERINTLTSSGRIDRSGLHALRDEVESARQVGMTAQLIARFAQVQLPQSREREMLGITLKPMLKPADVLSDPTLTFTLLNTLLDWALLHAISEIGFTIDVKSWAAKVRLTCRFQLASTAMASGVTGANTLPLPQLDTLNWRLLEQTAAAMQLRLVRQVTAGNAAVSLEFELITKSEIDGISAFDLDQGADDSVNSKPLAGSHVVVVASRRDVRVRIRDAIRHMGLIVDMVASIEEASDFCRDGLPHAFIIESILQGERFDRFCAEIRAEVPGFPFIDIIEEGKEFSVSDDDHSERARVGQEAIEAALPSVLMFELSKAL
jgi:hypothetical protein